MFIPPATQHGIVNDGSETLVYVSAASPPVSMEELYSASSRPTSPATTKTSSA